jgi:hypothetical protein
MCGIFGAAKPFIGAPCAQPNRLPRDAHPAANAAAPMPAVVLKKSLLVVLIVVSPFFRLPITNDTDCILVQIIAYSIFIAGWTQSWKGE